jgi:hypothetical protein
VATGITSRQSPAWRFAVANAILKICLFSFLFALLVPAAQAITIPAEDIEPFAGPCTLTLSQITSARLLSWDAVSGADKYVIGYRTSDGTIVGLATVYRTGYEHSGYDPDECLEYVMVAYDSSGSKVCSARLPGVGDCP